MSNRMPQTSPETPIRWLLSDRSEFSVAMAAGISLLVGWLLWQVDRAWVAQFGHAVVWVSLGLGAIHGALRDARSV